MSQLPTKEIPTGAGRFVVVPIAQRPPEIAPADWDALGRVNDRILDRVAYDHARARGIDRDGGRAAVQRPAETLRRRAGVCSDISALFEHLARGRGYTVRTISSDAMDHAWNEVHLAGRWWIVDVTWNGGDRFTTGRPLPPAVRRDPDFRRTHFLVTPEMEARRRAAGLPTTVHDARDQRVVDYEKTFEARDLIDRIQSLTATHNHSVARQRRRVDAYNRLVAIINGRETREGDPLRESLRARALEVTAGIRGLEDSQRAIDALVAQVERMQREHPLAVTFRRVR